MKYLYNLIFAAMIWIPVFIGDYLKIEGLIKEELGGLYVFLGTCLIGFVAYKVLKKHLFSPFAIWLMFFMVGRNLGVFVIRNYLVNLSKLIADYSDVFSCIFGALCVIGYSMLFSKKEKLQA